VEQAYLVRDGRTADVDACTDLALTAVPGANASAWQTSLLADIDNPKRLLVVGDSSHHVVGYGRAHLFEPPVGSAADVAPTGYYLAGVVVDPAHRRNGVGAALTRARLDWISRRARVAWYFANARNTASIALHEPFGFEEVTRSFSFPDVAFAGGEGILFRLELSSS
jgi:ribosomal protein S18 acetylase RimI-like enzyme